MSACEKRCARPQHQEYTRNLAHEFESVQRWRQNWLEVSVSKSVLAQAGGRFHSQGDEGHVNQIFHLTTGMPSCGAPKGMIRWGHPIREGPMENWSAKLILAASPVRHRGREYDAVPFG